jgi:hypothetical protein
MLDQCKSADVVRALAAVNPTMETHSGDLECVCCGAHVPAMARAVDALHRHASSCAWARAVELARA